MASTSTTSFFVYLKSKSKFPNSFLHSRIHVHNKPLSISLSLQPAKLSCSRNPCTPSSNSSIQNSLSKFISEKIAFFLIGSFIFANCFNKRPAFAVSVPIVGTDGVLEEDEEKPVKGKIGEGDMHEKVLENDPGNIEGLKVIVHGKIRRGKSKEADKFVKRLIDVEPNEIEWKLLLALCYETSGNLKKAKKVYTHILDKNPLLVRALHGLAMVMHKKERRSRCI